MNAARATLVGLVAGLIAFACERSPTAARTAPLAARTLASASALPLSSSGKPTGLVVCPQLYDSVSQVIGPAGGVITVGHHLFVLTPQVLTTSVRITAVAPADTVRWVRFQPNGLVFQIGSYGVPAILYTSYKDCRVPLSDTLRIAQVTDALSILAYLQPYGQRNVLSSNQYAVGLLWHFSNYAVAW
jgi:hypothetical protein